MPDYRRNYVPGGMYFFTLKMENNAPILCREVARQTLGDLLRQAKQKWSFEVNAFVLLPDHLHCIWTLPPGDVAYPTRWGWVKKEFSKEWLEAGGKEQPTSASRRRNRRRGVWQRRYWEHTIKDQNDFDRHFDYIHYNPVKHGYVLCPQDWLYTTFHRWLRAGVYQEGWGCVKNAPLDFSDLDETAME